ncbi:major facilitator superfamily domain-containing protein [Umbelopsis sp. AD052]|nr:major facilitator superfamily domain-containing protein [Umbelopsis sp. AD052]
MSDPEVAQTAELTPRQILKKNALPIIECFYIGFLLGVNDGIETNNLLLPTNSSSIKLTNHFLRKYFFFPGNFGIILPRLKEYYNISDSLVSILFICQAVGYFLSAFLNGWLVKKLKALGALYLGSVVAVVAYILLLFGLPFPAMCCFMAILGGALALLDAGCNVFPSFLPYATTIINFIHAFYGLGALVGPLIASSLLANNLSWKVSYMILCGMAATVENSSRVVEESKPVQKRGTFTQVVRLKYTWIVAIFLLFYVGIETTIGGWGYTFLTVARYGDAVQMGRVMSGYWAGLTVGRVILGHITGMFGEKRMITLYCIITCGMVILIWKATSIGADAAGLVIAGFFLGPMFPTAIAITHQTLPKYMHATAIGFIAAFGQGGVAFFPFINGQIIDKAGINAMMPYTLGLSLAATIIWIMLPTKTASYDIIVNAWKKVVRSEDKPAVPKPVDPKPEEITETSLPVNEEKSIVT